MPLLLTLKGKLLAPITVLLIAAALAGVTLYYLASHQEFDREFDAKLQRTQTSLQTLIELHAGKMAVALAGIAENEQLVHEFLLRDRRALLSHSDRMLDRLREEHHIAHWYFIDPDRSVFLRVHRPASFGDSVARQTLQAAVESGKLSFGVELGSSGDLMLRAVLPWRRGASLLGYLEIGEEVTDLVLESRRIGGLEAFVALFREQLPSQAEVLALDDNARNESPVVVVAKTMAGTPPAVRELLASGDANKPILSLTAASGQRKFQAGLIPIQDVSGRNIGRIALLDDVTAKLNAFNEHFRYVLLITAACTLVLFAVFYELIDRTERRFNKAREQFLDEQARKDRARLKTIEDLEHGALYDSATALPNRSLLLDRLSHQIIVAQRERRSFAVVLIELTNFRELTDTVGETLAEQLLQLIAFRFKEGLRKSDTAARCGPEQFAVILPTVDMETAIAIADKIGGILAGPFSINDLHVDLRTDIGIALYPYHGQDAETLLRRADSARGAAAQEKAGYAVYDSRRESARQQQLSLLSGLQRAINNDELALHYFPRVDMRTSKINGVEALLRWRHTDQGYVLPEDIVALAEKTGLIRPLSRWVLNRALRQQANWQRSGIDIGLSINVSAHNLSDANFIKQLEELTKSWGVAPPSVTLEISERAITGDPAHLRKAMNDLHAFGVQLALDDVGAGNSSLAYLKSLPVSEIKIDQNVIYDLPENQNNLAFVRSTIALAHGLGIAVAAEGVKNKAIWDTLVSLGCDMAQGFHICQPTTSGAFECWLVNSKYGLDRKGAVCAVRVES